MNSRLETYINETVGRFEQIPTERKQKLNELASYVQAKIQSSQTARLTFICTHNSRRSHLAQVWAQTAAAYYGLANIETFSGGTEATAFNPRAVAALQRAGFEIEKTDQTSNPVYRVRYDDQYEPMTAWSKVYNHSPNPTEKFCAVMTCSEADQNCPVVVGAEKRVSLPYVDPKEKDGTAEETAAYDDRCRQISSEMFYCFSRITYRN